MRGWVLVSQMEKGCCLALPSDSLAVGSIFIPDEQVFS